MGFAQCVSCTAFFRLGEIPVTHLQHYLLAVSSAVTGVYASESATPTFGRLHDALAVQSNPQRSSLSPSSGVLAFWRFKLREPL